MRRYGKRAAPVGFLPDRLPNRSTPCSATRKVRVSAIRWRRATWRTRRCGSRVARPKRPSHRAVATALRLTSQIAGMANQPPRPPSGTPPAGRRLNSSTDLTPARWCNRPQSPRSASQQTAPIGPRHVIQSPNRASLSLASRLSSWSAPFDAAPLIVDDIPRDRVMTSLLRADRQDVAPD